MKELKTAVETIAYIENLPHYHRKNDLSFIKRALNALGDPQDRVKTVHVTGTNGKGSTCYYISSLLQHAGQKTGLFVSPYVVKFNERIQLDGQMISDEDLIETANQILKIETRLQISDIDFKLTTFEFETAMAFWFFAKQSCDYAVIEVGIGGEHDKTNVIVPQVSVITTIGLDHEKIIGPTLADIAREKSGVIKTGRPVILGNIPTDVLPILLNQAKSRHAPVFLLGQDFEISVNQSKLNYCLENDLCYQFKRRTQVENFDLAIAVTAFLQLKLSSSKTQVEHAIDETRLPGRYQVLNTAPLIVVDGAHNVQAMSHLLDFMHHEQTLRSGRLYVIITLMKDKDIELVFNEFSQDDRVFLTTLDYPRVAKRDDFPQKIRLKYDYHPDFFELYQQIEQQARPEDLILITGSFYLAGAFLQKVMALDNEN